MKQIIAVLVSILLTLSSIAQSYRITRINNVVITDSGNVTLKTRQPFATYLIISSKYIKIANRVETKVIKINDLRDVQLDTSDIYITWSCYIVDRKGMYLLALKEDRATGCSAMAIFPLGSDHYTEYILDIVPKRVKRVKKK